MQDDPFALESYQLFTVNTVEELLCTGYFLRYERIFVQMKNPPASKAIKQKMYLKLELNPNECLIKI